MQKTTTLWMLAVVTVVGMSLSACGQAGGVGPANDGQQGNQPAAAQT
jgi:predicted small lipoprotein YifL